MRKQAVSYSGQRYQYILTIQDVFSRYLLRPPTHKTSKVVSKVLGDLCIEIGPPTGEESFKMGEEIVQEFECEDDSKYTIPPTVPWKSREVTLCPSEIKIAFNFGQLRKSGVNWAKQPKEYQKLQNEESMAALQNKSAFEVFYGSKSNAVLNHISGGRKRWWW